MISPKWKYINRNQGRLLVMVPGWAVDYRIFDSLDLKFNYLMPVEFSPFNFEKSLLNALKDNNIKKISLFGFSLGGFLAAEFASKHKNLIEQLILIGIREKYKEEEISQVRKYLTANKNAYLYKFYAQCFSKKEHLSYFKKNLLKHYCQNMDLNFLLKTLDYLANTQMRPEQLNGIEKIKIIHGEGDNIAPMQEAANIGERLAHAEFIGIKNAGHIPFLNEDFKKHI